MPYASTPSARLVTSWSPDWSRPSSATRGSERAREEAPRRTSLLRWWPDGNTLHIDTAFLLLVSAPGGHLADHRRALVTSPCPPGLHFAPKGHHVWFDDAGALALGIWQGGLGSPPGERCERWLQTDRGIVVSTGSLRWSGQPWTPEAAWARQLDAALQGVPLR